MSFSQAEMDAVYEAARNLLNEIGLGACQFSVEPQGGMWELRIVGVTTEGKVASSVPIDHHLLKESLDDHEVRLRLRHDWTAKLIGGRNAFLRDAQ